MQSAKHQKSVSADPRLSTAKTPLKQDKEQVSKAVLDRIDGVVEELLREAAPAGDI
jgi:hypothetical protein